MFTYLSSRLLLQSFLPPELSHFLCKAGLGLLLLSAQCHTFSHFRVSNLFSSLFKCCSFCLIRSSRNILLLALCMTGSFSFVRSQLKYYFFPWLFFLKLNAPHKKKPYSQSQRLISFTALMVCSNIFYPYTYLFNIYLLLGNGGSCL
jgi:hypothetical protein